MPKAVEERVEKFLSDPSFYPDKTESERRSIAYALANTQLTEGSIEAMEFLQVNSPTEISIKASGQGRLLVFKNAVLARAETNKNGDALTPANIQELADTIGGMPIDVEHDEGVNCGVYTDGRAVGDALSVDGIIWADRYPQEARGVQEGTYLQSVEAEAALATCSVCGGEYPGSLDYCDHLLERRVSGAVRGFKGLKARGGAVTRRPAGTGTHFDRSQVYLVASHQENNLTSEELPMKCPHCGKDGGAGEKCTECNKIMSAAVLDAQVTNLQAEVERLTAEGEAAKAEKDAAAAKTTDLTARVETLTKDLDGVTKEKDELVASLRRKELAGLADEDWEKQKATILAMTQEAFNLLAASYGKAAPAGGGTNFRIPVQTGGGEKEPLTL